MMNLQVIENQCFANLNWLFSYSNILYQIIYRDNRERLFYFYLIAIRYNKSPLAWRQRTKQGGDRLVAVFANKFAPKSICEFIRRRQAKKQLTQSYQTQRNPIIFANSKQKQQSYEQA